MPGAAAFQKRLSLAVLLPESFRGGCSFGAELLAKPDLSRKGSKAKDDRLIVDRPAAGKRLARPLRDFNCGDFSRPDWAPVRPGAPGSRSDEHTSELQSLMRTSYAVFCLKQKTTSKHK